MSVYRDFTKKSGELRCKNLILVEYILYIQLKEPEYLGKFILIEMEEYKEYLSLEINGNLLQSSYSVYIVEIKHLNEDKIYYYIGQTGDTKEISARSPFYRISAHLGYYKSTQNQIYEGLLKKLGFPEKGFRQKMEDWFKESKIKIHYFKTDDFEFMDREIADNLNNHHIKRRKTLQLETELINVLKERGALLNLSEKGYKGKEYSFDIEKIIEKLSY